MNILSLTYFLNGFLMIAMPVGLTIYLTRKFKQGWRLFWIGAATFIFSQVLHIPFNALVNPVFNQFDFIALPVVLQNGILSVFLGLSAGLFEELSRYAMYRWWAKDARSWGKGLLAGVGHGGSEAIILGLLVLYGYGQMIIVRGMDISTLVTPDKVELAKAQIQAYWSAPLYMTMLGALERLFTIPLHLACSVLVLQAFTRKKFWWVDLAILFHALADGVAVFASQSGFSALAIEGIIGIFAIVSMVIVFALRQPEPSANPVSAPISTPEFKLGPVYETKENLDKTRYQ
ncbi:MAG: YhfC family intramembrane metalloprotease [Candidatus Atribacteria bacterium]|nr:YhfC family intramembrane metalloprotease [Candidatus Atribacteria bacterium]